MAGVSFGGLAPKRLLRRAALRSLDALGLPDRLAARARARGEIIVLNLHRVSPRPNPYWSPLHPRNFDALLAFVKTRFRVLTFGELGRELERGGGRAGGKSPLVLSFDDGYHDFLEYAVPLLEKHGLRANQNVVGACVLGGRPPWNVELADFLNQCPAPLLRELRVPGLRAPPPVDDASRGAFGLAFSRHLKTKPREERRPLVDELFAFARRADYEPTRVMNLDEVREVARLHEVGSHSYSHESMGLESLEFFEQDLARAARFHEDHLGAPLTIYAFPNGSHRREQVDALFARGVEHVLLVGERTARDARLVPRVTFHADSPGEVRLRAVAFVSQLRDLAAGPRAALGLS